MSLDNVIAIAGAAKGSWLLIGLGLATSIPLIIAGAAMITALFERFPILVQAGAALLGWVAGEMLASDPAIVGAIGEELARQLEFVAATVGAVVVLAIGAWLRKRRVAAHAKHKPGHHKQKPALETAGAPPMDRVDEHHHERAHKAKRH
jgi:predicted tellurium resistance membrane protein TerC